MRACPAGEDFVACSRRVPEDVAPLAELAQAALPVFGQHPGTCPDLLGYAKILELLEPADEKRRLGAIAPVYERPDIDPPLRRPLLKLAVERRESVLSDLPLARRSA